MKYYIVNASLIKKIYKKREEWCHKYDFGSLLIIGGSKFYSGSIIFNALSAYRAGCDLVTIVAPKRAADIAASYKPDIIAYPLNCDYFSIDVLPEVLDLTKNKTAIVIGGGMTKSEKVVEFVLEFLKKVNLPCAIDADAIYAVSRDLKVLKENHVLLPHAYEFYLLSKAKVENNVKDRIKKIKNFIDENKIKSIILLKGHYDVIVQENKIAINKTGSVYMTKGGTGDTLAGICGALLARNVNPFDAACASAFINGKAGEYAAKKYKESLMASDLIEEIPNVLKKI